MRAESIDHCSWCGDAVEREDGWRAQEIPGLRRAAFCRLEHVVPWEIQGAHWDPGEWREPGGLADEIDACAHCGARLGDAYVLIVRRRGPHRIPDAFCSAAHMAAWAKSGGRWG
jgi:hypothetical protein